MTYTLKDYENYLEKLKELGKLDWVKNYLELKEKPNFWTIIEYGRRESSKDRSAHETRMSKMIRWMMDPNENHKLGNVFAHKLMDLIGADYEYYLDENIEIKAIAEYHYIDVFYKDVSQKMCLAIELKQHAKEGINEDGISQLDRYESIVEDLSKKKGLEPHYIYLTPLKDIPTNKNWHSVGYQEFIDLINDVNTDYVVRSYSPYIEETQKIIMDFRDELQRNLDMYKKDISYITSNLKPEERDLTSLIAREISGNADSKHMDSLMKVNGEDDENIKELIFLVNDHLYVQDHSPNDEVKILIRKIYNYLSGDKVLDTVHVKEYPVRETKTNIKPNLVNSTGIKFTRMELTRGKGQGINMYTEDGKRRIYMSGDTYGRFPNDGVQLLKSPGDGSRIDSEILKVGSFQVKNNLILENMLYDKNGNLLDFDQFMNNYVIPSIEELSNKISHL